MTEATITSGDLNRIMARIQKLITLADHANTGEEEAATFRAKAEEMMRTYRIAEENLIATAPEAATPQLHRIWLGAMSQETATDSRNAKTVTFYDEWYSMLAYAAGHAGVRYTYTWGWSGPVGTDREYGIWGEVVGYEGDVRLCEMLYSSARVVFGDRIQPRADASLSDEENIYRLRGAGITRRKVARMLWDLDTHAAHARVGEVYKAECARRGETPALDGRGVSAATYRDAYAREFVDAFGTRLRRSRDAADSVGGALVLSGRTERVDEAFYDLFPFLRPNAVAETEKAPAKPVKPRKVTKADAARIERLYGAAATAGRAAGRKAAEDIEIGRPAPAQRLDDEAARNTAGALNA